MASGCRYDTSIKAFFEFQPQCKITLSFNNRPRVRGQDKGTWRRFCVVPFEATVGPEDVGPVYKSFHFERAGILQWLLNGAERWFETRGLVIPERVRTETSEFRAEQDPLSQFLEDYCLTGEAVKNSRTRIKDIFEAWRVFSREQGEDPGSSNMLGRKLKENDFTRIKSGDVFYKGIELNEAGRRLISDISSGNR